MNNAFLKNMKLFILAEYNHSYRKIIKLVKELGEKEVNIDSIINILGDTPTTKSLIDDLGIALNSEHYSLWCLTYYGVSSFCIEKIKNKFEDLNILVLRIKDLPSVGLQEITINKINKLINDLKLTKKSDLENEILLMIEEKEPITNRELKMIIFSKYNDVDSKMFDSLIDSMLTRELITNTIFGYKIKHHSLEDYLVSSSNEMDVVVLDRCKGKTLAQCGEVLNLTRERVRQKVYKRIMELPIFDKEKEYFKIQENYSLKKKDAEILGFDIIMWNYIGLKYKSMSSEKSTIDYLKENNLCDTQEGRMIFKEYHLIIIDNEIVKNDFIDLFIRFIYKQKYNSFEVTQISDEFNNFLLQNNIENKNFYIKNDNIEIICRKLENSGKFLNTGSKKFILFEEDAFSSDFIELMKQYLVNFEGYGSVLLFLKQNKKICKYNQINNEHELFIIMKKLFSKDFENKIDFIRNPTLAKKGIDREIYIENLLLDLELPCEIDTYLNYINSVTGLKKASVASSFANIINKYKNVDGLLSLDDEYSKEEGEQFKTLLNNRECIGTTLFEFQVKKIFRSRANIFLNSNTIRKFGYCKTSTSIYKKKYQSRLEAVQAMLKDQKIILDELSISKFTNVEFLIYRQYNALKDCLVLKIGNNKYLNIVARKEQDSVKQLKIDLLNLLEDKEIYVLDEFVDSLLFSNLMNKENKYNNILYSFDIKEILKFVFSTTDGFSYLTQGDTFLFSKDVISYETIINHIMVDNVSLSINEFKEIMYDVYKITKTFSNTELSNMGYYCPYTSEKIYLNKNYYEYEMEEYLNENS